MATPREMVTAIETALAENPVGVVSVSFDGQTTAWSHDQALAQLRYWRRRASKLLRRQDGAARSFSGPDLSGAGR